MNRFLQSVLMVAFLLPLSVSCDQNEKSHSGNIIDVAAVFSRPEDLKASAYFKTVRYVPLETTDESLIGKGARVRLLPDKILITTDQKQCLLFDRETGKYLRSIGHIGNDPGGYSSVNGWVHDLTGTFYFNGWKNDWICYDAGGNYQGQISLPAQMDAANYLDEETYISLYSDLFGGKQDSLFLFNREEVLKSIPVSIYGEQPLDTNDIDFISVLSGESGAQALGAPGILGAMFVGYKEADKVSLRLMGSTKLWHTDNGLYFKNTYNDTIFQIKDQELTPSRIFQLGDYHWPYSERNNRKQDQSILITQILEGKDILLFRFTTRVFHEAERTHYNSIYNKATGEVKVCSLEKGILDDRNNFLPYQPQMVTRSGEYAGLYNADDIAEWFEEHAGNKNLPKGLQSLKSIREDDNPVVYILE